MRATRIAKFAVLAIAGVALFGFIVMSLWNWILPPVTGWHPLTYWQALGLLVLSKILFGSFRGRGMHWRRGWMQRWERMTPEEREKFRDAMRHRCGFRDDATPTSSGV